MTIRSILTCDGCGRTQILEDASREEADSWGVLTLGSRRRDVCPLCIAGLGHGPQGQIRQLERHRG